MQKEFKDIVFEFAKKLSEFNSILSVTLFGSVAREEADKRSDVDFFVLFKSAKPVEKIKEKKEISKAILDMEKKYNKNIQVVFSNKKFDKIDRQFIENVFREGIILYGKEPKIDAKKLKLRPYSLIFYSLKKMNKSDKMRLKKAIYGHRTKKEYKGKIYKSEVTGLVESLNCKRTGIASVLAPAKTSKEFESVLKGFGAEYEKIDVWISEA